MHYGGHAGYGHTNGHKTTAEQIDLVFQGLKTNGLCRWSRCLTGKSDIVTDHTGKPSEAAESGVRADFSIA